jgi:V8-like Glu-specific endopeptidase
MSPDIALDPIERVRDLLARGELERAVEQLCAFVPALGEAELTRDVRLQAGNLASLRKREWQGVLAANEASAEERRLRGALLAFTDYLEGRIRDHRLFFPTAPVLFAPPEDARLEKIFGVNHLKRIAWLAQGLAGARSVCRVVTATARGTGFLVEGNRLLTNHHVIPDAPTAARSSVEFNYEEDITGKVQPVSVYALIAESVRASEELDYCFVDVQDKAGNPSLSSWGWLPFERSAAPSRGDHVTIIQHPDGGPKQIAITANQVVNIFGHRLQYTTDTLPGSSGAPVFNDEWRVIALHHTGGNLLANVRGDRMYANEGILIADILRDARL